MLILLDCDGVLADLTGALCEWRGAGSPEDHRVHCFREAYGISVAEEGAFFAAVASGRQRLQPYPGAAEFVRALERIGEVYACTATAGAAWTGRRAHWLEEHVGIPAKRQIICGRAAKAIMGGDVLIDDSARNCAEWALVQDRTALLFDRPWSRGVAVGRGVRRAFGYDDCLAAVEALR